MDFEPIQLPWGRIHKHDPKARRVVLLEPAICEVHNDHGGRFHGRRDAIFLDYF